MRTSVLLVASVCILLSSCSSNKPVAETKAPAPKAGFEIDASVRKDLNLTVARAEEGSVGTPVSATGQLQVNEDATWVVGAMTDGRILSVPVGIGDFVRQGQPLAFLHSHDVHDARATLRQATSELARQKVLLEQARAVRDRARRLFELRAMSREQLEAAEAMYQSTTNSVAAAQADVDKATFHLTDYLEVPLEAEPGHGAGGKGDGLTIKSPAAGTLMERKATAGTVVSVGDPVFTVADLSSLWLIAAVNEADMSRISPGQRVNVSVRAFADRTFPGKVLRLGERLDAQTRTLQVRVLLPNPQGLLKPQMFATAEFETGEQRRVIEVPEAAVQDVNGKAIVFVSKAPGSYRPQEVTVGAKSGGRVQILSGLQAGDSVVVNGAYLLKTQMMNESGE